MYTDPTSDGGSLSTASSSEANLVYTDPTSDGGSLSTLMTVRLLTCTTLESTPWGVLLAAENNLVK